MSGNLLDSKTVTFRELLGNGKKYKVPVYQRDYSWKEEHWEELWLDIKALVNSADIHYLGSIVLQNGNREKKIYTIIDGQQRLATLSILILAAVKVIQKFIDDGIDVDANKQRKEIIINGFLGSKDAVSLTYASKLALNETNDNFYQTYLLQFRSSPKTPNDSNGLLFKAFVYFASKLADDEKISKNGESVAKFIESVVADKLIFIQITVDNELSAYTVFETLNARGMELSATDLLKNYLFSLVKSDEDIKHIKQQWHDIAEVVGIKKLPQFLRYYLNSRQTLVRKDRLFKELKLRVNQSSGVFELLAELGKYARIYAASDDEESELWIHDNDIKSLIQEIALYDSEQHKPLLMNAYLYFSEAEFIKVLRIVRAIVFRYTVISGKNTNSLEEAYNKSAVKLYKQEIKNASGIMNELRGVYIGDEDFKNAFSMIKFDTASSKIKKLVRYILFSLENQKHNKSYPTDSSDVTIEHILPENPSQEWVETFDQEKHDTCLYRLGNLTLLEEAKNRNNAANKPFSEKKNIYQTSQYGITSELLRYSEWTERQIRERQRRLAETAATIWKADY